MKRPSMPSLRFVCERSLLWLGLLLAALLLSCGDGQSVAGVGTGGTGLKEGNVSGFGSVFIDGVRYDNSQAVVQMSDGGTALVDAQFKLGQRVRAHINAAGQVTQAEILPALVGWVDQTPDNQGYLMVMGQWVRFVSKDMPYQNTLSSNTYLSGYDRLADIAAGDVVEVHGSWFSSDPNLGQVLVASRIEKRTTTPKRLLVTGAVDLVDAQSQSFGLTTADGRQVVGNSRTAAVGDWVKLWVDAAKVRDWDGSTALQADHWSALSLPVSPSAANTNIEISGLPELFDANANTVKIQGMAVRLDPATLSPANKTALQTGTFSQFSLSYDAQNKTWSIQNITPREGNSLGGLTTVIAQSDANTHLTTGDVVQLRGVDVQISSTLVQSSQCLTLATDTTFTLEITGTPEGSRVQAQTLVCKALRPP